MRIKFLLLLLITTILAGVSLTYAMGPLQHTHLGVVSPKGGIEGQVLDAEGQPVLDAEVYALKSDFSSGRIPSAYTDEKGVFSFKDLPPGTYLLSVAKKESGFPHTRIPFYSAGFIQPPQVTVYEQQTTPDVVLYLGPKAARLIGEIVDATTGKPIKNLQNAQIKLQRIDYPDASLWDGPDLKGKFTILVPSAPLTIEVSAAGYKKWDGSISPLNLPPGTDYLLNVPLTPDK